MSGHQKKLVWAGSFATCRKASAGRCMSEFTLRLLCTHSRLVCVTRIGAQCFFVQNFSNFFTVLLRCKQLRAWALWWRACALLWCTETFFCPPTFSLCSLFCPLVRAGVGCVSKNNASNLIPVRCIHPPDRRLESFRKVDRVRTRQVDRRLQLQFKTVEVHLGGREGELT